MWTNRHAAPDSILDEPADQVALRKRLGFTRAIIGDDRRAIAWATSADSARDLLTKVRVKRSGPLAIVVI